MCSDRRGRTRRRAGAGARHRCRAPPTRRAAPRTARGGSGTAAARLSCSEGHRSAARQPPPSPAMSACAAATIRGWGHGWATARRLPRTPRARGAGRSAHPHLDGVVHAPLELAVTERVGAAHAHAVAPARQAHLARELPGGLVRRVADQVRLRPQPDEPRALPRLAQPTVLREEAALPPSVARHEHVHTRDLPLESAALVPGVAHAVDRAAAELHTSPRDACLRLADARTRLHAVAADVVAGPPRRRGARRVRRLRDRRAAAPARRREGATAVLKGDVRVRAEAVL